MIDLQLLHTKLIIPVALGFLMVGCTTVTVISPVATQNERNAISLKANAETLVLLTDTTLPALLEIERVANYRDTLLAIRHSKYRPTNTNKDKIQTEYAENANKLKDQLASIDHNLQPVFIKQFQQSYPLTASVAFGQIQPDQAASIWLGIEQQAYQMTLDGVPSEKVFKIQMTLIAELPNIKRNDQAKQDILDAYKELRNVLLAQAASSVDLAKQLRMASQTSSDPNAFLKGVSENNKVLQLIGESIAQRTGDPERKKAANELLDSLTEESAAFNIANTGK